MRLELTYDVCREMGALGEDLADIDPDRRAGAALLLSQCLGRYGLSIESLLLHRREWGARPDLSRSCDALVRHFAGEAWPVGDRLGCNDEAMFTLEVSQDTRGRQHPADMMRVLGMWAVAMGDVLDPDTAELRDVQQVPAG